MTVQPRSLARPDARGRIRIPNLDENRDYAVDQLPGGAYMISPATIMTDAERALRVHVRDFDELLKKDGKLHTLPEGENWDYEDPEVDAYIEANQK